MKTHTKIILSVLVLYLSNTLVVWGQSDAVKEALKARYPDALVVEHKTCYGIIYGFGEENQKTGICDFSGKELFAPDKYTFAILNKDDNYIMVEKGELKGACDVSGKEVVPCKYASVIFLDGKFKVQQTEDSEWIDYDEGDGVQQESSSDNSTISDEEEPFQSSLFTDDEDSEADDEPEIDKDLVERYINRGNSCKAYEYLKKIADNSSDAETEYQCAFLMQGVIIGLGNELIQAIASMNVVQTAVLQFYQTDANNKQITWLALAAQKGHEGANKILQMKVALLGGGSSNFNYQSSGTNNVVGTSSTRYRICESCKGTGKCGTCHGTGSFLNGYTGDMLSCTNCSSSNDRICTICDGTGKWVFK